MEDVGTATFNPREVEALRAYLMKGGFVWVDDFWGTYAWADWVTEIGRVLPPEEYPIQDLTPSHPIYRTQFEIKEFPQIPSIQAWRITWLNPAGDHHEEQIGRRSGNDVVQIGTRPDGTPTRWSFTDITDDSFHWLGEALEPDGKTWRLEGEFRAARMR